MSTETNKARARAKRVADALKLSVKAEFVPVSRSRNAAEAETRPTLNWRVTLERDGREIMTTDYSAGMAHCPAYSAKSFDRLQPARYRQRIRNNACREECEKGKPAQLMYNESVYVSPKGKPIMPDPLDVLYSLAFDSDVIDYPDFESWASEFGYDTDSRSAEATYQACLKIGLAMQSAIGAAGLARLRNAFQDY